MHHFCYPNYSPPELKSATPKRGAIRCVPEGFGFFDASNFNRSFRSEFGFIPSEIVGICGVSVRGSADA